MSEKSPNHQVNPIRRQPGKPPMHQPGISAVLAETATPAAGQAVVATGDVFWARSSIGQEMLDLWLDTYHTSRSFRKRGIGELELP